MPDRVCRRHQYVAASEPSRELTSLFQAQEVQIAVNREDGFTNYDGSGRVAGCVRTRYDGQRPRRQAPLPSRPTCPLWTSGAAMPDYQAPHVQATGGTDASLGVVVVGGSQAGWPWPGTSSGWACALWCWAPPRRSGTP